MFKPNFTITPKLLANVKKIGIIVSDLNNRHFDKISLVKLERNAREVSVYSSTSIEGNVLPLTEVKKIIQNQPKNLRNSEKEIVNYNLALKILDQKIQFQKFNFDLSLILKIQKQVTKGLISTFDSGKLRKSAVFVNDPRVQKPVYLPPDHQDVEGMMDDLIMFVDKNVNELDPLILAGIFHKQFVIIHPFVDGNGRTARLMTKVLLANMGLDTFNLFSFENYYNQNVTKYFKNVGVFGNYYDIKNKIDFTSWLEYFTDGITDELLRVKKILEKEEVSPKTILKPYHKKIINYIKNNGFIADRDYAKLTSRAKPTRNNDFNKLISLGLIERLGKGKATYYKFKR